MGRARRPGLVAGLAVGLVLALAWLAFALSPYLALYRLAGAVRAHDAETIARRVNVRALRASLTRQALSVLAEVGAGRREFEGRDRQLAADAAATIVEPVVAALVTPETIADLLADGRLRALGPGVRLSQASIGDPTDPGGAGPEEGRGLRAASLAQLGRLWLTAEARGFRNTLVSFPPDRPRANRFRLRLRLTGWTWRLVEVDLPSDLRAQLGRRLAAELPAATSTR